MIRLLSAEDNEVFDRLSLIGADSSRDAESTERVSNPSYAALRIWSLRKAYGCGYDFLRFYASEDGGTVLCVQDGFTVLWTRDSTPERLTEAAEFLPFTAEAFLTEVPLPLEGYRIESGNSYCCETTACNHRLSSRVHCNDLDEGFQILSQVFPEAINQRSYAQWYTDISHRVRHGVSKLYTIDQVCVGVRYGIEEGWLGISQLATLPEQRGRGLAGEMLSHIAAETMPEQGLLVQSQTPASDRFYERAGYTRCGRWYTYRSST